MNDPKRVERYEILPKPSMPLLEEGVEFDPEEHKPAKIDRTPKKDPDHVERFG